MPVINQVSTISPLAANHAMALQAQLTSAVLFAAFANLTKFDKGQPDQICWGALVRLVTDVAIPNVNVLPCSSVFHGLHCAYTRVLWPTLLSDPFRFSGPRKEWTRLGLDVATGELQMYSVVRSRLKIAQLLIVDLCSFFVHSLFLFALSR